MNGTGRLTIPAEVRSQLGLRGPGQFELDVEGDAIVLRPAIVLPREDAWAYTPEHRALLEKAHRDIREGRVRQLAEEDLLQMAAEADRRAADTVTSGR